MPAALSPVPSRDLPPDEPARPRLAIVDDDPILRRLLRAWLEPEGYEILDFDSGRAALQASLGGLSAALLDLGLGDLPGLDVLRHWRAADPELPVVVLTARADLDSAVEAVRAGAYDYLTKPPERGRLLVSVSHAIERAALGRRVWALSQAVDLARSGSEIVGQSAAIRVLREHIQRVLQSDIAVCLLGESGTGKELIARAIHHEGRRSRGPFVAVNCGAIPESLIEAELFGYEKGAFSGATAMQRGRFEQAEGGTLFLDEIGDMPLTAQVRLLRALQEKSIRRVGGTAEHKLNVRVIAATHRDLEAEVQAGRFRQDLYFRLMAYPIESPPLRDRRDDIPLLVAHFLRTLRADVGRDIARIAPEAIEALSAHTWPGNVRELQNVIHRAMLSCRGDRIELADLPPALQKIALPPLPSLPPPALAPAPAPALPPDTLPTLRLQELEALAIKQALRQASGHVANAARLLGLGRATLYRRIVEMGDSAPGESPEEPER